MSFKTYSCKNIKYYKMASYFFIQYNVFSILLFHSKAVTVHNQNGFMEYK
ncbi:MAG TPA: hypothetical protein PLP33_24395 [Leptospiraceae bacterium]|nr:hypothetical protein [Leptospiraceae bacterium]HNH57952.1 hypothetical protein [Leptospiraceae bacterium]